MERGLRQNLTFVKILNRIQNFLKNNTEALVIRKDPNSPKMIEQIQSL